MNYEQAKKAQPLAPGVMKVLERLEVEKCWRCKGSGYFMARSCEDCDGTGKIHYSWTPQVGEWVLTTPYTNPELIYDISEPPFLQMTNRFYLSYKVVTPILEWEEIEKALRKAGYYLHIYES